MTLIAFRPRPRPLDGSVMRFLSFELEDRRGPLPTVRAECNLHGIMLDRHPWRGPICSRCGARRMVQRSA